MSSLSEFCCVDNRSYQHIQGIMLKNLNNIATEINLSHTEYRLMGVLIGLWNKKYGMAFPNLEYLAKNCRMAKSTIIKALNKLVMHGLITIVKSKRGKNNYYMTNKLLQSSQVINSQVTSSTCKTGHDNLTEENITNKLINNDFKNKPVETERTTYIQSKKKPDPESNFDKQITQMIKHKYWKHIPTDKIYKTLPDIGIHWLIRYNHYDNTITFIENELHDKLDRFIPANKDEYDKQNKVISLSRPSKQQLLKDLISQNKLEEARVLANLWRIDSKSLNNNTSTDTK